MCNIRAYKVVFNQQTTLQQTLSNDSTTRSVDLTRCRTSTDECFGRTHKPVTIFATRDQQETRTRSRKGDPAAVAACPIWASSGNVNRTPFFFLLRFLRLYHRVFLETSFVPPSVSGEFFFRIPFTLRDLFRIFPIKPRTTNSAKSHDARSYESTFETAAPILSH